MAGIDDTAMRAQQHCWYYRLVLQVTQLPSKNSDKLPKEWESQRSVILSYHQNQGFHVMQRKFGSILSRGFLNICITNQGFTDRKRDSQEHVVYHYGNRHPKNDVMPVDLESLKNKRTKYNEQYMSNSFAYSRLSILPEDSMQLCFTIQGEKLLSYYIYAKDFGNIWNFLENSEIKESQNHQSWKRPLRTPSLTINPALPC